MQNLSRWSIGLLALALMFPMTSRASNESDRADVRQKSQQILAALYAAQPAARVAVEKATGYATFSNFGLKILVAGGGKGAGLAVDNASKKETFMKMLEVQAGLGFGIKQFEVVFVFENRAALDRFVNQGWEFGGQTTFAAKEGDVGGSLQGAMSVSPGVWMYQITKNGLAAEISAKGTRYYKDDTLNQP
jgi:lipid-binding SYLF domain-containing protein